MRPLPTILALAAVALPLAPPVAAAPPPKKTCHLLKAGQRSGQPVSPRPIVISSADIASNDRDLTTVVRVENLDDPQHAAVTKRFLFGFSVSEEETYDLDVFLRPLVEPEGWLRRTDKPWDFEKYDMRMSTRLTAARVVVDHARGEVRTSVSMDVFRSLRTGIRPGVTLTYLGALTSTGFLLPSNQVHNDPPVGLFTNSDWAHGKRKVTYRLGTPSCVTPGR